MGDLSRIRIEAVGIWLLTFFIGIEIPIPQDVAATGIRSDIVQQPAMNIISEIEVRLRYGLRDRCTVGVAEDIIMK